MLRLILQVGSSNHDATFDYDFAYVELTLPRVKHWIDRIQEAHIYAVKHKDFYAIQFWDSTARYCTSPLEGFDGLFGDEWETRYAQEEWGLEPESFIPPAYEEQRTECDTIKITNKGLWWSAIPKHGDTQVSTAEIRLETLYEIRKRLRGNHLKTR